MHKIIDSNKLKTGGRRVKKSFFTILNLMLCIALLHGVQSCGPKEGVKAEVKTEEPKETKVASAEKKELTPELIRKAKMKQSMARSKQKAKVYDVALKYYTEALEIDPEGKHLSSSIFKYVAETYEELGKQKEAEKFYFKHLEKKPEDKNVLVKLEYKYVSAGDLEKAIDFNKKILEIEDDPALYKKIGNYYMQIAQKVKEEMGEDSEEVTETYNSALEWLEKYQELKPEDQDVEKIVVYIYSIMGDLKAIISKLEDRIVKDPKDYKSMKKLAKLQYKENNMDRAKELYEILFKHEPKNADYIKRLIVLNKDNSGKLQNLYKAAIKADPKNDDYHVRLAKIYIDQKKFVEARNECKSALRKNPNNKNAYKTWARIYVEAVSEHKGQIEFQDQLVYAIAYGLYKQGGDVRISNSMKENGQTPSKSDIFTNGGIKRPSRGVYKWINKDWDEVKYIDQYLKQNS